MNKNKVQIVAVVLLSGLFIWCFLSVRSCVRERRWLAMGTIENSPRRIWDVRYTREFNDMNPVHVEVAQALGVPAVANREAALKMNRRLVELHDTDTYRLDELTHSIPFLVPQAKKLLDRIGENFRDSLQAKGLNPNLLLVTSVLRTQADVDQLRKGNLNASENSTHRYGTTFDLSYWHYVKVPELRGRPYADVPPEYLRAVLGQVLKDLHDEGACYIKYEKKQACFHITVRK
ncbi:MAG: hypothetical protein J6Y31_00820 [Bacteroidales bacterium]|nr:hypothetical protein [Bacteroidales bacterium]MBP5373442.1 hypothetical protein [Bacteroidales bacterium]